ncbi:hypothetical protein [Lentibacter sp. XHP0401]|uniref:hypothetical protein n=1 Tax=Lentibacter sp. XHP0401 TaxID=2984334 RepID=UPI0021E88954|nr:hypothetical protein [Lentibacter sp. XHP0401]MCV2892113.1 hypothetical protein [Lentibacter sp. XHP0401]
MQPERQNNFLHALKNNCINPVGHNACLPSGKIQHDVHIQITQINHTETAVLRSANQIVATKPAPGIDRAKYPRLTTGRGFWRFAISRIKILKVTHRKSPILEILKLWVAKACGAIAAAL